VLLEGYVAPRGSVWGPVLPRPRLSAWASFEPLCNDSAKWPGRRHVNRRLGTKLLSGVTNIVYDNRRLTNC